MTETITKTLHTADAQQDEDIASPTPNLGPDASQDSFVTPVSPPTLALVKSLLYAMGPTGIMVSITLPQVASDNPLFAYRVSPMVPPRFMHSFEDGKTTQERPIYRSVFPNPTSSKVSQTIIPVIANCPLFSSHYASGYRHWRGSMSVRFVVTSSYAIGGRLVFGVLPTTRFNPLYAGDVLSGSLPLNTHNLNTDTQIGLATVLSAPHVEMDLSLEREAVLEIPALECFTDEQEYIQSMTINNLGVLTTQPFVNQIDHVIVVCARGSISTAVSSVALDIQIDQAIGPDMELANYVGFDARPFR